MAARFGDFFSCMMDHLPADLILQIASNIDNPHNLFKFYSICKYVKTILSVDFVWRNCRKRFAPYRQLPPLPGMSEMRYALLVSTIFCMNCKKFEGNICFSLGLCLCPGCESWERETLDINPEYKEEGELRESETYEYRLALGEVLKKLGDHGLKLRPKAFYQSIQYFLIDTNACGKSLVKAFMKGLFVC